MNLIIVKSNKIWQNIPDKLCFQLLTSSIERIAFIRFTNKCQLVLLLYYNNTNNNNNITIFSKFLLYDSGMCEVL